VRLLGLLCELVQKVAVQILKTSFVAFWTVSRRISCFRFKCCRSKERKLPTCGLALYSI